MRETTRKITYRSYDSAGQAVPFLPIEAKFLQFYNFSVGDRVIVFYGDGLINIRRISNDRPDPAVVAVR